MDVTLETDRLRMRMFTEAYFDAFASILADPEVMTFLGEAFRFHGTMPGDGLRV